MSDKHPGPHTAEEWIAVCDDQQAELEHLRAENERLKSAYNDALQRIAALVRSDPETEG